MNFRKIMVAAVLLAVSIGPLVAEETTASANQEKPGTLLLSRDFTDGQIGMVIHNATPGAQAKVVDLDGRPAAKVTVPFALRVNRHQLQFFWDKVGVDPKLGAWFLVTVEHRDGSPHGLAIAPEMVPLWTGNEYKGHAKLVLGTTGNPDPQGWAQVQYLFQVDNNDWDGYLLQFRLLFFRDNAEADVTYEGFVRNMELRQLTDDQASALQAREKK